MARRFVDTNVLVYTDDASGRRRARIALATLERLPVEGTGVVNTPVLREYFVVTTRKLDTDPATAPRKLELFATMEVVRIDVATIVAAIDRHRLHRVSFCDALIVSAPAAAAAMSGLPRSCKRAGRWLACASSIRSPEHGERGPMTWAGTGTAC